MTASGNASYIEIMTNHQKGLSIKRRLRNWKRLADKYVKAGMTQERHDSLKKLLQGISADILALEHAYGGRVGEKDN